MNRPLVAQSELFLHRSPEWHQSQWSRRSPLFLSVICLRKSKLVYVKAKNKNRVRITYNTRQRNLKQKTKSNELLDFPPRLLLRLHMRGLYFRRRRSEHFVTHVVWCLFLDGLEGAQTRACLVFCRYRLSVVLHRNATRMTKDLIQSDACHLRLVLTSLWTSFPRSNFRKSNHHTCTSWSLFILYLPE